MVGDGLLIGGQSQLSARRVVHKPTPSCGTARVGRIKTAGPLIGVNGLLWPLERPVNITQAIPGQRPIMVNLMALGSLLVIG